LRGGTEDHETRASDGKAGFPKNSLQGTARLLNS
jgi:hypothetical protein